MNFRSIVITALGIATIGFSFVPTSIAQPTSPPKLVNLLSAEKGGHVITATGDEWLATIDGDKRYNEILYAIGEKDEAVYGFKDEKKARLQMFTMLINETHSRNVKEFELFVSDESPTGPFLSIGKFQTQNMKLYKTPFQQFNFPQVSARYFKVKLLSTHSGINHALVDEIQLFGKLEE
jgi:hypothetical protein